MGVSRSSAWASARTPRTTIQVMPVEGRGANIFHFWYRPEAYANGRASFGSAKLVTDVRFQRKMKTRQNERNALANGRDRTRLALPRSSLSFPAGTVAPVPDLSRG